MPTSLCVLQYDEEGEEADDEVRYSSWLVFSENAGAQDTVHNKTCGFSGVLCNHEPDPCVLLLPGGSVCILRVVVTGLPQARTLFFLQYHYQPHIQL